MRKLAHHVLSVTLILGTATALAGCVIEARAGVEAGGHAKPKPAPKAPAPAKPKPVASTKPTQTPAPQTTFETDSKGALKLPGPVLFETGKDVLKPESDAVLQVVKDYLDAKPQITKLRIEGHTDNVGTPASNMTLSQLRAYAVAKWLVAKGVRCNRLLPVGFGDTRPVADNTTEDGRAQNRRTMFVNAELKGSAIGGMPVDGGGTAAADPCR
ncbi:MAG: OmpA family protein [Polyangiaceae bacterium]